MGYAWMPARLLREGCSTSPILFNVYHQAVKTGRRGEMREETGVGGKWLPGGSFEGGKAWEKGGK